MDMDSIHNIVNMEFQAFNDKNVTYTGSSSSLLDITQGEALSIILDKLVIALANLTERVNSCSFCEGEDNSISLAANNITTSGTVNQNPTIISGSPASIKSTPNASGININFDLDPAIASLGDVTILSSKTSVQGLKNGFPARILDTSKTSASVNLRPDNFPATLSTEIKYQDSTGEKTIGLSVPLSNTSSELNLPLQGKSSPTAEINTQEDLNINLQSRLLGVENLVNSLNNVNISGFNTNLPANSNINQALAFVLSEIESIKASINP